ncbi:RNA polymerase sigma factor [Paenarthrobacter nicotinovorans]|uniref:RNA polymerase sigma factor n=1 Tax=Paenarthrobacter nicotinovorans TaxID=29320 RepID=UPI001AE00308|nr:sigma-70 family RNA polymerase sigma factor [Paenarthrobacter nicotinovorans]
MDHSPNARIEDLLRSLAPQVLAVLARKHGQFDACEDAVQEALLEAAMQWPSALPDNPRAWLITVATRRLVDFYRSENARRAREERVAAMDVDIQPGTVSEADDTLTLMFLCCHPALSAPSQLALTLRAVGGLTTAEIASAFMVPEATMGQRISRAKQGIQKAGATFTLPPPSERKARLGVVLHVLYLIFNEGYAASSGASLQRQDLTTEAIRVTRLLVDAAPRELEAAGLLALMLLTDSRRSARALADGMPVPLAEQDRSQWNRDQIQEGIALLSSVLGQGAAGPYQLQAAIAAVHAEAASDEETDWPQILALYTVLDAVAPSPVVTLNRAVAVARVHGPAAGLELLAGLDEALGRSHRLDAVRAHLLDMAGSYPEARAAYLSAAKKTASLQERRYLLGKVARMDQP